MKNAGLLPPLFENNRGVFKVTLFNGEQPPQGNEDLPLTAKLLNFCATPKSREEIANYLGLGSTSYAMRNITPLINSGQIKMTKPEAPKSKNQKYVSANLPPH